MLTETRAGLTAILLIVFLAALYLLISCLSAVRSAETSVDFTQLRSIKTGSGSRI
jgi:hypothetical protein